MYSFSLKFLVNKIKIKVMTDIKTKLPPLPKKWEDLAENSKDNLSYLYCIENFELSENIINKWFLLGKYEICEAILSRYKNHILKASTVELFSRGDKKICLLLLSYFTGNLFNEVINETFQEVGCNIRETDLYAKYETDFCDYQVGSGSRLYDNVININIPFCDLLLRECPDKVVEDSISSVFLFGGYHMRVFF